MVRIVAAMYVVVLFVVFERHDEKHVSVALIVKTFLWVIWSHGKSKLIKKVRSHCLIVPGTQSLYNAE